MEQSETEKMKVCRVFMDAVSEGQEQEVKVVCFEEKVELCQGIKDGDRIIVLGSLNIRTSARGAREVEIHARNIIPVAPKKAA